MKNAVAFFQMLVAECREVSGKVYCDDREWTKFMKQCVENVISGLKKGIHVQYEYYRIDCIGWTQRKDEINAQCEAVHMRPHLWELDAAVEYENNGDCWLDEVCKLAYIRCPLRVVISYGLENAKDNIKLAKAILDKTDAFTDDDQEFLIILGHHANEFQKNQVNPCGFQGWRITKADMDKIAECKNQP